jgi:hypothetical protein
MVTELVTATDEEIDEEITAVHLFCPGFGVICWTMKRL